MLLFRLLGFARLGCGCLVGRYHQLAMDRDLQYVEEKGCSCTHANHRRNQPPAGGSDIARIVRRGNYRGFCRLLTTAPRVLSLRRRPTSPDAT